MVRNLKKATLPLHDDNYHALHRIVIVEFRLPLARRARLGDFFTDEKVSQTMRAGVPLVVADDGTICWIAGHRIDDRVKVSSQTERFLWIEFEGD